MSVQHLFSCEIPHVTEAWDRAEEDWRRHIAEGEQLIAKQRKLIGELEGFGADVGQFQALLVEFERRLGHHVAHANRLRKCRRGTSHSQRNGSAVTTGNVEAAQATPTAFPSQGENDSRRLSEQGLRLNKAFLGIRGTLEREVVVDLAEQLAKQGQGWMM